MAEDILLKVGLSGTGEAAKSVKDLKNEIKLLQAELSKTTVGSERYFQVLEKLGAVKGDIQDLGRVMNALDAENKVAAFANVAGKLAGGFQAATGAAALFGVQSEELEKTLLRVQAATALSQGIQSVVGMKDAFIVLGSVIAANPIMAIAGIITTAAGAIALMTQNTADLAEAQKTLNKSLEDGKKRQEDYADSIFESNLELQVLNKTLTEQQANILKLERQGSAERKKIANDYAKTILDLATKLGIDLELIEINQNGRIASVSLEGAGDQLNNRIKFNEEVLKLQQRANEESIKLEQTFEAKKKVARIKGLKEESAVLNNVRVEELEFTTLPIFIKYAKAEVELKMQTEMQKRIEDRRTAELKEALEQKALERKREEARVQLEIDQNYFNAVGSLSSTYFNLQIAAANGNAKKQEELRKKQFQVEKAFRAGQAVIDTYKAINATLAAGGALATPLAVSIGVAGFANVAKILSQQYNGGVQSASADVNVNTGPQIQTQAPNIGNPITRLNEQGQNQNFNNRVYVLESDISESQGRVAKLQEQATF
jgi:hypothetical protein